MLRRMKPEDRHKGYVKMEVLVNYCSECTASYWFTPASELREICISAEEAELAIFSGSAGAVMDAPGRMCNSNIQLASLRLAKTKTDDEEYNLARAEIWPWLTSLLVSDGTYTITNFARVFGCCIGRTRECIVSRRHVIPSDTSVAVKDAFEKAGDWIREVLEHDRSVVPSGIDGVDLVLDKTTKAGKPLAVKFGPTVVEKCFHANEPQNIHAAVEGRIIEKHVPMAMTSDDVAEMHAITEALVKNIQESKLVDAIAHGILFSDCRSKKWTPQRQARALELLMSTWSPQYKFSAAIKCEPMVGGKPPRLLIADGDAGQVMSSFVMAVLERYLFKVYKKRSIKGVPKSVRMEEISKEFNFPIAGGKACASVLENDGSAWDTCMSHPLRAITEVPVINAIMAKIEHLIQPYASFNEQRARADKTKTYVLRCKTSEIRIEQLNQPATERDFEEASMHMYRKEVQLKIASIRRSGDRGTSVLNWLANHLCWCWVLCGKNGVRPMGANTQFLWDLWGTKRRFLFCFEGDDSLLLLEHQFTEEQLDTLARRWTALGHRPKLYLRAPGDRAEFCGTKFLVDPNGIVPYTACPDLPRHLANAFYSHAKEAVCAAQLADSETLFKILAPGLLARAAQFAERLPSIARFFARYADDLHGDVNVEFSRDDLYRIGEADASEFDPELWTEHDPEKLLNWGLKYGDIRGRIDEAIANGEINVHPIVEASFAVEQGWATDQGEWARYVEALSMVTRGTDVVTFRSLTPSQLR